MRVSDYVIEFFENQGVDHIFTVSGGGSIFLCDALGMAKKMKYVACHHEQAASMATLPKVSNVEGQITRP